MGHVQKNTLFQLFGKWRDQGALFSKISDIDENVGMGIPSIYLKHDVHDMCLDALIDFASKQVDLGIIGSYFFMPNGHPRTRKSYSFSEQAKAMRTVQSLGHEVGIHVDPYFLMVMYDTDLQTAIEIVISDFSNEGIEITVGNMHGNSRHNHADINGYGTSFELFDEVSRHSDFPKLSDLQCESAELVRQNRVRLSQFGIKYWADMPIWSSKLGFVRTNFLTDNQLGKKGTFEFVTCYETIEAYLVCDRQPPGSRNVAAGKQVFCRDKDNEKILGPLPEKGHYDFLSSDFIKQFSSSSLLSPLLVLIHPEFYQ